MILPNIFQNFFAFDFLAIVFRCLIFLKRQKYAFFGCYYKKKTDIPAGLFN